MDAKVRARDIALHTWNRVNALSGAGRVGGTEDKEAQARAQYYLFQEEVQNALIGRLQEGTRNRNGSTGGTFRATTGVQLADRRLRLIMGELPGGKQLYRPTDEPILAEVLFDWDECVLESLSRRAELRLQKWVVLRNEKELIASQNFLLPEFDLIGRYRWRGFGRDLYRQGTNLQGNAIDDLTTGKFAEWQLGFEFSVPIGRRQAFAAVRNAELSFRNLDF